VRRHISSGSPLEYTGGYVEPVGGAPAIG
jgi:hypothetical protein